HGRSPVSVEVSTCLRTGLTHWANGSSAWVGQNPDHSCQSVRPSTRSVVVAVICCMDCISSGPNAWNCQRSACSATPLAVENRWAVIVRLMMAPPAGFWGPVERVLVARGSCLHRGRRDGAAEMIGAAEIFLRAGVRAYGSC